MIFFHNDCTINSTPMFTAYPQHIHTVFVYNYTTQYTDFAVYICFPFHNVIFFHNHCPIHSTTMFTAYTQHIHTVLFTITLPSTLALLFIYAFLFTMWYFTSITAQFTLQQCLWYILNIYIHYCLQLQYPVYWLCCLHMLSFSQCDIFSQLQHNWLYKNVYSISLTYTYSAVYNSQPSILYVLLHMLPFHNVIFFHNHCPIHSTTNLQHIINIYIQYCLQLHNPVYCMCFLHMLPFHNVIFFHNHCTIYSTTVSTAYPQHIHTVLFTITLPSILTLLFIYASFTQCDIFSQLLHNWLYNNVYSISLA